MLLLGLFELKLDDKNRIRLPAKFREQLGNKYVVTPFGGGCLAVYRQEDGQKMLEEIVSKGLHNPDKNETIRQFASFSATAESDSQGRFMLPDLLVKYADLKKDIVIVGSISKVEVWSAERWAERQQKVDSTIKGFDTLMNKIDEI